MTVDWAQLVQYVFIGISAAAAAIAAAYGKRAANAPATVIQAPVVPLALTERVPTGPTSVLEGGAAEIAATILPWMPASYVPAWSQNAGVLPDGVIDPGHWNDCGEMCVSMCVAGVWGVPVEAGAVRQYLQGPEGSGLTDGLALRKALRYYSVKSHVAMIAGEAAFRLVLDSVAAQRVVIMLGTWEGPGTALHWMLGVSDGAEVIQYVDPWDGARAFVTKANWLELYAGQLVILDSHLHFDCRTWPQPS
jgi:hypothetical protein